MGERWLDAVADEAGEHGGEGGGGESTSSMPQSLDALGDSGTRSDSTVARRGIESGWGRGYSCLTWSQLIQS